MDAGGPGDHTRTSDLGCIPKTGIARSEGRSIFSRMKLSQFSKVAGPVSIPPGENVQSHCVHLRLIRPPSHAC